MKNPPNLVRLVALAAAAGLCKAVVLVLILSVSLAAQTPAKSSSSPIQSSAPQGAAANKADTYYSCPMDPEVRSAKRGKCPKCGMALRLTHAEPVSDLSAKVTPNPPVGLAEIELTETSPTDSGTGPRVAKRMSIPDVAVLDQDGNSIHFYSDLIKNKTVAINFIFTNCTTICPPLAATFARVQRELGDKAGRDVHFISISVDPVTDTPERLKAWGAKFKAGPGWTFVTGDKQEIGKLLSALSASVARREDHSPTVIVGNDTKGVWTRTYGLAKTAQMVGLILNVIEGKTDDVLAREQVKP